MPCSIQFVGGCVVDALRGVADALRTAPGRKLVVFISTGVKFDLSRPDLLQTKAIEEMVRRSSPRISACTRSTRAGSRRAARRTGCSSRSPRTRAAGRSSTGTSRGSAVPEVFRENGSVSSLGYRSSAAASDGRYRTVQVKVDRPGLQVRSRSGFFPATGQSSEAALKLRGVRGDRDWHRACRRTTCRFGSPSPRLPCRASATPSSRWWRV